MPHWNQSQYVANAINSIINQTFQNWELVIVDDGSDTEHFSRLVTIIQKFDDNRITLIQRPHEGLVSARNYGCREAIGEFIITQDADDLSLPDRFEKCFNHITGKYADVVYHGAYINMWDTANNAISRKYIPAQRFSKRKILLGQYITGWPMFRKRVWERHPFRMETQYAYDWMMYLDWMMNGEAFSHLNEGLYEYVRTENSASQRFEKEGLRQQSIQKIREILQKEYEVSPENIGPDARVGSGRFG